MNCPPLSLGLPFSSSITAGQKLLWKHRASRALVNAQRGTSGAVAMYSCVPAWQALSSLGESAPSISKSAQQDGTHYEPVWWQGGAASDPGRDAAFRRQLL